LELSKVARDLHVITCPDGQQPTIEEIDMAINYVNDKADIVKKTTVSVEAQSVNVKLSTRHPSGVVQCDWTIDFSNATTEEIYELAKRSVVIMQQSGFRAADREELEDLQSQTIDVHNLMTRERAKRQVSVTGLANSANKLTPEQKAELIAALEGSME